MDAWFKKYAENDFLRERLYRLMMGYVGETEELKVKVGEVGRKRLSRLKLNELSSDGGVLSQALAEDIPTGGVSDSYEVNGGEDNIFYRRPLRLRTSLQAEQSVSAEGQSPLPLKSRQSPLTLYEGEGRTQGFGGLSPESEVGYSRLSEGYGVSLSPKSEAIYSRLGYGGGSRLGGLSGVRLFADGKISGVNEIPFVKSSLPSDKAVNGSLSSVYALNEQAVIKNNAYGSVNGGSLADNTYSTVGKLLSPFIYISPMGISLDSGYSYDKQPLTRDYGLIRAAAVAAENNSVGSEAVVSNTSLSSKIGGNYNTVRTETPDNTTKWVDYQQSGTRDIFNRVHKEASYGGGFSAEDAVDAVLSRLVRELNGGV